MSNLNDSLDDLIGNAGDVRVEPVRAPANYQPRAFDEVCGKCRGTGQTRWGACFKCKGAGKKSFKTSPETRAKARASVSARKERVEQDSVESFKAEHRAAYEWLVATAPRWELAASLLAGLHRYGSLTDKQLAIVTNGIARDAARTAERAERAQQAPTIDTAGIDRLKVSFDKAIAYTAAKGLRLSPKVTIGGMTIKSAKAASTNPGALYVNAGQTYLGKIAQGRFFASRDCRPEQITQVQAFIADPGEAAKVYGQTTGTCCICNATLRSEWKLRGIGPICAEKFGW